MTMHSIRTPRPVVATMVATALSLAACQGAPTVSRGPADRAVETAPSQSHQLAKAELPDRTTVAGLAAAVSPSVVNITTRQAASTPQVPEGLFKLPGFGELPMQPRTPPRQGAGSGFILRPDGKVVTNAHVVKGADEVTVRLQDDRELTADVIGIDEDLDVALLQLEGLEGPLPAVNLGDSAGLLVGEHVLAVGNPFGLGHTVTLGIVSAKARTIGAGPYDDFIQTDASINPGNSGGPLFNLRGEVIGINTAIRRGADGIGFAIPIDDAEKVIAQLADKGFVERGRLGVRFQPIDGTMAEALGLDRPQGALVAEVESGGPADEAGFEEGDVILAVDGVPVRRAAHLPRLVAQHAPGTELTVEVLRDGERVRLRPTLARLAAAPTEDAPEAPKDEGAETTTDWGFSVRSTPDGLIVTAAEPSSRLAKGDLVLEAGGQPVSSVDALLEALRPQSGAVLLKVRRGERTRFVAVER